MRRYSKLTSVRALCTQQQRPGVTIAVSPWRTRLLSRGNKCNRSSTHSTGSDRRTGPKEKLPLPFFSIRGGHLSGSRLPASPTRRRYRTEPRTKLLRLQKTHPSRDGVLVMPCQFLHIRFTQATFLQHLPPHATDPTMEVSPYGCPPTGGPPLPTEHSGYRPLPATAASSRSTLTSDPSSVALTTVHAMPTLQGDAVVSPPSREGGCACSIANQTASRRLSRDNRSPRCSKCQVIQHIAPAGAANASSPAISTLSPAAAAAPQSIAPAPV